MSNTPERIPCPCCAERILPAARKCKHCGEWLEDKPRGQVQVGGLLAVLFGLAAIVRFGLFADGLTTGLDGIGTAFTALVGVAVVVAGFGAVGWLRGTEVRCHTTAPTSWVAPGGEVRCHGAPAHPARSSLPVGAGDLGSARSVLMRPSGRCRVSVGTGGLREARSSNLLEEPVKIINQYGSTVGVIVYRGDDTAMTAGLIGVGGDVVNNGWITIDVSGRDVHDVKIKIVRGLVAIVEPGTVWGLSDELLLNRAGQLVKRTVPPAVSPPDDVPDPALRYHRLLHQLDRLVLVPDTQPGTSCWSPSTKHLWDRFVAASGSEHASIPAVLEDLGKDPDTINDSREIAAGKKIAGTALGGVGASLAAGAIVGMAVGGPAGVAVGVVVAGLFVVLGAGQVDAATAIHVANATMSDLEVAELHVARGIVSSSTTKRGGPRGDMRPQGNAIPGFATVGTLLHVPRIGSFMFNKPDGWDGTEGAMLLRDGRDAHYLLKWRNLPLGGANQVGVAAHPPGVRPPTTADWFASEAGWVDTTSTATIEVAGRSVTCAVGASSPTGNYLAVAATIVENGWAPYATPEQDADRGEGAAPDIAFSLRELDSRRLLGRGDSSTSRVALVKETSHDAAWGLQAVGPTVRIEKAGTTLSLLGGHDGTVTVATLGLDDVPEWLLVSQDDGEFALRDLATGRWLRAQGSAIDLDPDPFADPTTWRLTSTAGGHVTIDRGDAHLDVVSSTGVMLTRDTSGGTAWSLSVTALGLDVVDANTGAAMVARSDGAVMVTDDRVDPPGQTWLLDQHQDGSVVFRQASSLRYLAVQDTDDGSDPGLRVTDDADDAIRCAVTILE